MRICTIAAACRAVTRGRATSRRPARASRSRRAGPASLLTAAPRVRARSPGSRAPRSPTSPTSAPIRADGRTPRWLRWVDGVAVVTDGESLCAHRRARGRAASGCSSIPRPALVVADGPYAEVAAEAGIEVVAFAGLDRLVARRSRPRRGGVASSSRCGPTGRPAAYRPLLEHALAGGRPRRSRLEPPPRPVDSVPPSGGSDSECDLSHATGVDPRQLGPNGVRSFAAGGVGSFRVGNGLSKARFLDGAGSGGPDAGLVDDRLPADQVRRAAGGAGGSIVPGRREPDVDAYLSSGYTQAG